MNKREMVILGVSGCGEKANVVEQGPDTRKSVI